MFSDKIFAFLMPIIGENAARRLILAYCSKNNITPAELKPQHLPLVGQFLAENIRAFVGSEKADMIVKALSRAA